MPLYQSNTPQPIEVNGRGFTWTEFDDGTFEILSDDGRFSLRKCGKRLNVHGEDFPDSTAERPLNIQLHPGNVIVRSRWDRAKLMIQQCLDGNYTLVSITGVDRATEES